MPLVRDDGANETACQSIVAGQNCALPFRAGFKSEWRNARPVEWEAFAANKIASDQPCLQSEKETEMTNPYSAPNATTDGLPAAEGVISGAMLEALRGTRGWVKLVGILLLVSSALVVFSALAMAMGGAAMRGMGGAGAGGSTGAMIGMAVVYLIFAVLYIILGLHLVRYAGAIKRLLVDGNAESMVEALQHQQKFWRLAGGLALIGLIFMVIAVIGIVAAVVIPMMAR